MPDLSNHLVTQSTNLIAANGSSSTLMATAVMLSTNDKSANFTAYFLLSAFSLLMLGGYVWQRHSAKVSHFCSNLNLFGKKPGSSLRKQYATIPDLSDEDPYELLELKRTLPSKIHRIK